jgi:hypothetical protein
VTLTRQGRKVALASTDFLWAKNIAGLEGKKVITLSEVPFEVPGLIYF